MTITCEQVADLQPGDVVEITWWEDDAVGVTRSIRGPLHRRGSGGLYVGSMTVVAPSGEPWGANIRNLTVVSRAPRPMYVNHPRTEPVPGDVVNPADGTASVAFRTICDWIWPNGTTARLGTHGLRLLIDGETGQVVP